MFSRVLYTPERPPTSPPKVQSLAEIADFLGLNNATKISVENYPNIDAPVVVIRNGDTRARVIPGQGSNLIGFDPSGEELIWHNPATVLPVSVGQAAAILRGGDPLCGPYFGKLGDNPDAPIHGELRRWPWTLISFYEGERTEARFELLFPGSKAWPHPFQAAYQVAVEPNKITTELEFVHLGQTAAPVNLVSHRYTAVTDDKKCKIVGLEGIEYADMLQAGRVISAADSAAPDLTQDVSFERRYKAIPPNSKVYLVDPDADRVVVYSPTQACSAIFWRPSDTRKSELNDIPAGSQIVCVEFGDIQDQLLEPRGVRKIGYSMQVIPLTDELADQLKSARLPA